MRRYGWVALLLLASTGLADPSDEKFSIYGFVSARGIEVEGQPSWLQNGFGRLDAGASGPNDTTTTHSESLQLGIDFRPTSWLNFHVHAIGRDEPSGYGGSSGGVVEAYADLRPIDDGRNRVRIRTGMFFLPTSRENVDDLWSSPYTLTLSALNTWIAEELRPIGSEIEYRRTTDSLGRVALAVGGFEGNDSSGALLAWRGWALGSHLSTYGEVLPLPPLFSLQDPTIFGKQRSDGTKPFGSDLDGKVGWSERLRWDMPDRATLQIAHVDNGGDRNFYQGEYSWRTRFYLVSGDLKLAGRTTIAAELASGSTGMGNEASTAFVQMNFYTAYAMISQQFGRNRLSLRVETFQTDDEDHSRGETNSERGSGITLAYFRDVTGHLRLGIEYVDVSGRRIAAAESGFDPDTSGRSGTAELRYRF